MIIFQYRVYRSDLQLNPGIYYVFGDNDQREGLGGQAGQMRGENNAIGVRTKRAPNNNEDSFYADGTGDINKVMEDFEVIEAHLRVGKTVVFPTEGVGTGLSELPTRAPEINAWIEQKMDDLLSEYGHKD